MKLRKYTTASKQIGFTLLETMIYLLLMGVVLSFATMFSLQLITTRAKAQAIQEATQNARFSLSRLAIELREADGINFGTSSFGTNPGTLSLKTGNPATDPTIFTVSSGQLTIKQGAAAALPLTTPDVEVIDFTVDDVSTLDRTRAIRVNITVRFVNPGGLEEFNATVEMDTTIRVRKADGFSTTPPSNSTFEQSAYRLFANQDSTDVGSALAAQDTAVSLSANGDAFRLRALLHIGAENLAAGGQSFKLQYAVRSGTCDSGFSGETYADVTGSSAIAFNDNSTPADAVNLTANAGDPTHGGDIVVAQTYEEANHLTSLAAINIGQDGLWDFSLIDNDGAASNTYCLRLVKSDSTNLDTYSVIPEVTTAVGATSTFEQSAYRSFANVDSTGVGSALAAQDTAATLTSSGDAFRLRSLLHIGSVTFSAGSEAFKLQFAVQSGTCDTGFSGETYADVGGATAIAFNDNVTPADGAGLTSNAGDPTHGADLIVAQTYEEANTFTSTSTINAGEDGLWDFALIDNGAPSNTTFCLRIVKSDNSTLDTYSVIPEVTTAIAAVTTFNQSAYRLFANQDSTDVGAALAAQDTSGTLASAGDAFRLRTLVHVGGLNLSAGGESFKLQFAARSGACDTSFTGETYADVTGISTIAYNDNATPVDGAALTSNALDPTHGGDTVVAQTYEEANTFTSTSTINAGEDGLWDFALIDNGAPSSTTFCLRIVKSDNSIFDTYSVIPEVTSAGLQPGFEQSAYRVFANQDSTDVGAALAAQDTGATLGVPNASFRLRNLIHITTANFSAGAESFKLQFATRSGTCDTAFSGETYVDVTGTSTIAYNDNATPVDGAALTSNASDPTHGGDTVVDQTYEEGGIFTSTSAINIGEDGQWDFSLVDNNAPSNTTFCLRIVKSGGGLLDTYSVVPEITTSAPAPSTFEQSAYRVFANQDSTDVGVALAVQDSATTLSANGDAFRIRQLMHVGGSSLAAGGESFKLQFAEQSGACDTGFVGETYADVTTLTAVAFNDNATPADGAALTGNALDPTHGGDSVVDQTYEEANTFTNTSTIAVSEDGMWDFSLYDRTGAPNQTYCFRIVKSDNSQIDTYSVVPEVTMALPQPVFRVTEYPVTTGFTGTTFTLTLNQDLVADYFVIVQGADGNGAANGNTGPDENYAALSSDPFGTGDLTLSGGTNLIGLTRNGNVNGWQGVVTTVECLTDCDVNGFRLRSVERTVHTGTATAGSETSATAWTSLGQTMLMGGFNGAGCDTPEANRANHHVCHARIFPSGTTTIIWTRDASGGTLSTATSTVMAVEWGSVWIVQRVNVTGTAGGPGADAAAEYDTGTISSVLRGSTWVWGIGHTADNGIGDSAEGTLITLGDGAAQNVNETTVAVGQEYSDNRSFEVYALTHANLAVDYRFKVDGDSGSNIVDVTVDAATAGQRMGIVTNGQNGTTTTFPRSMLYAHYFDGTTVRLERRRNGQTFPAWVQGIDFSGITAP